MTFLGGLEAIIWVVIFALYMAYRAFSITKKKQAEHQKRQVEIEAANRRRRGEVLQEDVNPRQELPWDFDPDDYKEKRVRSYRVEIEQASQEEENIYQRKLKAIGDEKRSRTSNEVGNLAVNEEREPAPVGFSIQLDNKSLVNAVIMSEVLQPPRAKRPIRI